MGLSIGEKYRARAEECARQAESAKDANAKMEWLKLAKSWQVLAENTEKTYQIVPPTSHSRIRRDTQN
jgi:hypothetical protein